jgi:hypothetical protein
MGWCAEFGVEIAVCNHPMVAGAEACACAVCGARCEGRFEGCSEVWAKGPVQVELVRRAPPRTASGGSRREAPAVPSVDDRATAEVGATLKRLEARLNLLEMNVARLLNVLVDRDGSSNGATTRASADG